MRDDSASAAAARARLASDPLRPQLHFTAPANWLNDPNGLIQWQGLYHLFYQYHPFSAQWGRIHWGHAVSDDLARWSDLPIALTPDPVGADADGCWSGCLVDDAGVPTIIYTGVRAGVEVQCVATGDDALVAWRKHPGNPVIAAPPAGLETLGFRDPCVWREDDGWRMLLATGLRGRGGAALLYASPDLLHWTYLHPLLAADEVGDELPDPGELGEIWECPGLFPLGDPADGRYVLLISTLPARRTLAFIGAYADQRFVPERLTPLDAGPSFYAPQAFRDARGRLLLFGWLQETRPEAAALAAGWSGAISAPRVLSRLPDGALGMDVAPEWEALRQAPDPTPGLALAAVALAPGAALDLPPLPGGCFEAQVDYAAGAADGVIELQAPGARLAIAWERRAGTLTLRGPDTDVAQRSAPCPDDEPIRLRLLVDRSIVEVFVNQRIGGSWRFYPADPLATRARVVAGKAGAQVSAIRQWRLSL